MANLRRRIPQQTESLFTENHEPFFNSIGQERRFPEVRVTSASLIGHSGSSSPAKCLLGVNSVTSSVRQRVPLFTQLRTYRCVALSDASGHDQTYRFVTTRIDYGTDPVRCSLQTDLHWGCFDLLSFVVSYRTLSPRNSPLPMPRPVAASLSRATGLAAGVCT
jgi:hypothetical protein